MVVAKRKIRLLSAIKPWSYSLYHHFTNWDMTHPYCSKQA
jgi:hypothetical protein